MEVNTSNIIQTSETILTRLDKIQINSQSTTLPQEKPEASLQSKTIFSISATRNLGFVGRESILQNLDELFVSARAGDQLIEAALCGLGGVG